MQFNVPKRFKRLLAFQTSFAAWMVVISRCKGPTKIKHLFIRVVRRFIVTTYYWHAMHLVDLYTSMLGGQEASMIAEYGEILHCILLLNKMQYCRVLLYKFVVEIFHN